MKTIERAGLAWPPKQTPILRWVGGKQNLLSKLVQCLPPDVMDRPYREPFAGAAAMFFGVAPREATLSDANVHLMECYRFLRSRPGPVADELAALAASSNEELYYRTRAEYNKGCPSVEQAARFIYLNRTCFNGVFRVNVEGRFNVPYGRKEPPPMPSRQDLMKAGRALRAARLACGHFETMLSPARRDDFVYLDPPYPPLNGTSYFTHYTPARFGPADQERVASACRMLDSRGCLFMLTNADTKSIRRLYRQFYRRRLSVTRFVTCKRVRHRVRELVIANYPFEGARKPDA